MFQGDVSDKGEGRCLDWKVPADRSISPASSAGPTGSPGVSLSTTFGHDLYSDISRMSGSR